MSSSGTVPGASAPGGADKAATLIFGLHTLVELVLGGIKLRGKYANFELPPGAEKNVRHHGVALLALALLGAMVLARGEGRMLAPGEGRMATTVLCAFHGGCCLAGVTGGILALHGAFFLAFAYVLLVTRDHRHQQPAKQSQS